MLSRSVPHIYTIMVYTSCPPPLIWVRFSLARFDTVVSAATAWVWASWGLGVGVGSASISCMSLLPS